MKKTIYTVRVTEDNDTKFRDVVFEDEQKMRKFKEMAEEDGTYWGVHVTTLWE